MSKITMTKQATAPDAPSTDQVAVYVGSDGALRSKDDAGVVTTYGAGGTSDHGALTGLSDDDHSQYLPTDGSRPMIGNLPMGGYDITGVNLVDGRDVSSDGTKLDGIEAGADVTDAANVAAAGAVMDGDFTGSYPADLARTGAGTYAPIKSNLTASVAPTVTDDSASDYAVGSRWIDLVADRAWICLDATVGAAVWLELGAGSAATPTFRGIRGFTVSDYLERATPGDLAGNGAGFEIYAVVSVDAIEQSLLAFSSYLVSTGAEFVGPGYHLWIEGERPRHTLSDGTNTYFSNFLQRWLWSTIQRKALVPISLGYDGANRFLKFGGYTIFSAAMGSFGASSNAFRVGRVSATASGAFANGTFLALAAKTDGVLTDAQHEEVLRTLLATGDLPDSAFTSRWSFKSLATGAVPSTVADQIGSNDLSLVGSLTVVNEGVSDVAKIGDPASTSVKIGGQIGGTTTSPDVRGMRESGGTLLTYGPVADGNLLRRNGTGAEGISPASLAALLPYAHPTIAGLTGFATGAAAGDRDYYEHSVGADPFAGQTIWTLAAMITSGGDHGDVRRIVTTAGEFINAGVSITYDGLTITFYWYDSSNALQTLSVTPAQGASDTNFVVLHYDNGSVSLYHNGRFIAFLAGPAGTITAGSGFAVGGSVGGAGAGNGAQESIIHGVGFHNTQTMDSTSVVEWYRACLTAGTFVPNPQLPASQESWVVTAGSNPSAGTWTPADGANNLSRTGSAATISEATVPLEWA